MHKCWRYGRVTGQREKTGRPCCSNKRFFLPIFAIIFFSQLLYIICMGFALGWVSQNHCSMLYLVFILHTFNSGLKMSLCLKSSADSFTPPQALGGVASSFTYDCYTTSLFCFFFFYFQPFNNYLTNSLC